MRALLCNDVDRIERSGGAQYGCMLNDEGGIIDDVIVYRWADDDFRLVSNAGTRPRVSAWLQHRQAEFDVRLASAGNLSMLAIQGPLARELTLPCLPSALGATAGDLPAFCALRDGAWQVARTGYTGEDGFEVIVPDDEVTVFWRALLSRGVLPCGLAARDTLRLEAGLRLYGVDMDEETTPAEAGLNWTVALQPAERRFFGREAIEQRGNQARRWEFAGLVLEEPGVLRAHQSVEVPGLGVGQITSGGYSPGLNRAIAFARLPVGSTRAGLCQVRIRDKMKMARVRSPRFLSQ
jgi:aminomethyltransferase